MEHPVAFFAKNQTKKMMRTKVTAKKMMMNKTKTTMATRSERRAPET